MTVPNGKIIAIGGSEDKGREKYFRKKLITNSDDFLENGILRSIVDETGGTDKRIEIITTASSVPHEVGEQYFESFSKIGCTDIGLMHIRDKKEINKIYLDRINNCDCIMFSGGTQKRLSTVFYNTEFLNHISHRYKSERLVVVGTSAGAMAMGNVMIYKGTARLTHLKGQVKTMNGFNLINNVIFDSHFEKNGRFRRLAQAVALNQSCTGVGLSENTGVIVTKGKYMKVIGTSQAVFIEGGNAIQSNVWDTPDNQPVSIRDLKVHLCIKGEEYTVKNKSKELSEAESYVL